jgi:cytochrome d ubiquinol oxidase subunit II
MELNTIWFILIAILYTGYFVLEGFDFGVGILLPFLGKDDQRRRTIINTIGPHWDGNEVWLITAGGATFAAFPHWYATLFSGFYLPLLLILAALIVRGVSFEFRSKDANPRWRRTWDWTIFTGSLLPALLWGVAFANFVRGVPIDASMNYTGGFWNLLNGYALLGGLASLSGFMLHGAIFLTLKTTSSLLDDTRRLTKQLWVPAMVLLAGFAFATYYATDILEGPATVAIVVSICALIVAMLAGYFVFIRRTGWAFIMTCLVIALTVATVFLTLYPRLMVSSLNPAWSLTITNAASGPNTLRIMTIVAAVFVPLVLLYQGWSYWVFRKRVTGKPESLTY